MTVHTHTIFLLFKLRESRSKKISLIRSIPSTQILVYNTIPSVKASLLLSFLLALLTLWEHVIIIFFSLTFRFLLIGGELREGEHHAGRPSLYPEPGTVPPESCQTFGWPVQPANMRKVLLGNVSQPGQVLCSECVCPSQVPLSKS